MKRKRNTILIAAICGALLFCSLICPAAGAAVLPAPEATGEVNGVSVVGNPDGHPTEDYNPDTIGSAIGFARESARVHIPWWAWPAGLGVLALLTGPL